MIFNNKIAKHLNKYSKGQKPELPEMDAIFGVFPISNEIGWWLRKIHGYEKKKKKDLSTVLFELKYKREMQLVSGFVEIRI